jgi:hypothetical protein
MSDQNLDRVTQELADIQRSLIDLPDDAFAERFELQKRQDALREEAAQFRQDWDKQRSDSDLLAELAAMRSRLASIESQKIDLVTQSGFASEAGPGADGLGAIGINIGIGEAHGAGDIQARIGRLKNILEERGVDVPAE